MKRKLTITAFLLALTAWLAVAVYGYFQTDVATTSLTKVVVGYQKADPVDISRQRGELVKKMKAKGYKVVFKEFQDGAALMTALKSGSIDYARLGDTPPVVNQAAGMDLVYVGAGASKENGTGVLVKKGGNINSLADLKGKRIAYAKGKVDAWVTWDPYTATAQVNQNAKLLITAKGLAKNRDFVVATRKYAKENTTVTKLFLQYLGEDMTWANSHKSEVSTMLSKTLHLSKKITNLTVKRRSFAFSAVTSAIVKEQQTIADVFYQEGIIKKQINVGKALLQ
ncbi:ABC transporter substrate-binding protein [Lacticaseibacillus hulanensis]|uniref:ABC transporter substrate-binding protein n=1 Tax=Lacticaseibacillus hulanensis TaxID=2493111 RepID=UPI000FD9591A|nr:ABC transporter substrate-binding protein [Lacticaseibacillus hulanensis]